jgi:Zn finger protein HypA/HybF involved in hydrogenase expression
MGHWTRELIRNEKGGCIGAKMICSECGQDNGYDKRMKFCPNCGCKMQEVENG